MLLLAFHIVAIGALILVVGVIAYRMGMREGVRRTKIAMEQHQPFR
ncbi:MAG: hypothetical protein IID61_17720 [SAR324 cluster bacterium]|nr:hypothetical protein [SAR324 cluster bacterium]